MDIISVVLLSFSFIFISELGDKTQFLVLSFSTKMKVVPILIGLTLGSLLSHGLAIMLGSYLGSIEDSMLKIWLQLTTYIIFICIGIYLLLFKNTFKTSEDRKFKNLFSSFSLGYIFIIALSIAIGEFGDKTFLASLGLGVNYPEQKIALIVGATLGMLISNLLAIFIGKYISKKLKPEYIEKFSAGLFIVFGLLGLILL